MAGALPCERAPRRRPLPSRVRAAVRASLAFLFSNVGVVGLVIGYTIAGAFMFQAIEGASERERSGLMVRERDRTAQFLWRNVTLVINPLNESAIKERVGAALQLYQRRIVLSARRGWDGGRSSRQWSFSNAFLYSMTVITTIGYGHLSPRTKWGKVATMFYALLGMPLFLLYLSNVGSLLARWFKCVYSLFCLCRGCPGFRRRRVLAVRDQLEISEPESLETPARCRRHSTDIPRNHVQECSKPYRYAKSRYSPDGDIPYRIRSQLRNVDQRIPLETRSRSMDPRRLPDIRNTDHRHRIDRDSRWETNRYRDQTIDHTFTVERQIDHRMVPRNWERRNHSFRTTNHNFRLDKDYRFPPDYRDRKTRNNNPIVESNQRHYRNLNDMFVYPEDMRRPRNRQNDRIEEWYEMDSRIFQDRRVAPRNMPHPNFHRQSEPPPRRGWSAPAPAMVPSESDFSYVSFDPQSITVPISVCVAILMGYLIFGSMIFGLWEQWDLLDGAYFCFISLTSIGFGDFVPGERIYTPRVETSFIVCSLYLMLGMALVAMCFNLMQEQVIHYFAGLRRAVGRICRCCNK